LGFVFWLGHVLDASGYQALPAKSVADALVLVSELNVRVDVIVIEKSQPDAAKLAESLRCFETRPQAECPKTIVVFEQGEDAEKCVPGAAVYFCKTPGRDKTAQHKWLDMLKGLFSGPAATGQILQTAVK
jgi:hypothetical protein